MPANSNCGKSNKYFNVVIFSILATLFIVSRAVYLDNDLPYTILHSYAVFDECYYTIPGFNLFHHGEVNPSIISNMLQEKNPPTNISQNLTTLFTLKSFGNNFYGLRMGSVLCTGIIFLFFCLLLKRILFLNKANLLDKSQSTIKLLLFFPLLYLLFDFSFLNAGRVAEPTIYRILALVIMLYIGSFIDLTRTKPWQSILLGFLAFANVSFVYIYNAFVYAAFGTALFIGTISNGKKNALKQISFFILGTALCLLLYQIYSMTAYNSSLLEVYKNLLPFQSRIGGEAAGGGLNSYIINITLMLMTNIFRFNLILLFVFLISLPVLFDKLRSEKSSFDLILVSLIAFLILQSIIINDYALRKLLVLFPLVVIITIQAYIYAPAYFNKLTPEKMRLIKVYWFLIWLINILMFGFYLNSGVTDIKLRTDYFMVLNFLVFLIGSVTLSIHCLFGSRFKEAAAMALLLIMLLPNTFLDLKYVFLNRTTAYRDTMISMGDKIDGKFVVGGLAYAFRMYNTSTPVLNFYMNKYNPDPDSQRKYNQYFDGLFADGTGSYSIGVIGTTATEETINKDYMETHGLKLEEEYDFMDSIGVNVGLFAPE